MSKLKLYRIDVLIYGTAYVKAQSKTEAVNDARSNLTGTDIDLTGRMVSARQYDDPALPGISLSPAATINHILTNTIAEAEA